VDNVFSRLLGELSATGKFGSKRKPCPFNECRKAWPIAD
jgi:hypothetical protein